MILAGAGDQGIGGLGDHLRLAQRALAGALSRNVADGAIGLDDAKRVADWWLRENAYEIYPLAKNE